LNKQLRYAFFIRTSIGIDILLGVSEFEGGRAFENDFVGFYV